MNTQQTCLPSTLASSCRVGRALFETLERHCWVLSTELNRIMVCLGIRWIPMWVAGLQLEHFMPFSCGHFHFFPMLVAIYYLEFVFVVCMGFPVHVHGSGDLLDGKQVQLCGLYHLSSSNNRLLIGLPVWSGWFLHPLFHLLRWGSVWELQGRESIGNLETHLPGSICSSFSMETWCSGPDTQAKSYRRCCMNHLSLCGGVMMGKVAALSANWSLPALRQKHLLGKAGESIVPLVFQTTSDYSSGAWATKSLVIMEYKQEAQ